MESNIDQEIIKVSVELAKMRERCKMLEIVNGAVCLQDVKDKLKAYIDEEEDK